MIFIFMYHVFYFTMLYNVCPIHSIPNILITLTLISAFMVHKQ